MRILHIIINLDHPTIAPGGPSDSAGVLVKLAMDLAQRRCAYGGTVGEDGLPIGMYRIEKDANPLVWDTELVACKFDPQVGERLAAAREDANITQHMDGTIIATEGLDDEPEQPAGMLPGQRLIN